MSIYLCMFMYMSENGYVCISISVDYLSVCVRVSMSIYLLIFKYVCEKE